MEKTEKNRNKAMESLSQKIDKYQDEILRRNYKNLKSFTFGGMILTGLIALVAVICWGHVYFTREYCICFAHFVLCNLFIHYFLKHHKKYTLPFFYVVLAPVLGIGIMMGTILDPASNAMTVMILLCTLFMFITDKPQRIVCYILCTAAVFLTCSYFTKTLDMFIADVVNLTIYLSIGLSVNMLTLKDRVESAQNYVLAIKRADHDALTSILNRGAGDSIVKDLLDSGQAGTFIIIDIDDFKNVNDTYGHQIGDEVICAVSSQLKTVFRGNDIVWRLGGDEFAVFALGLVDDKICEMRIGQVQERLLHIGTSFQNPLDIKISAGCSICAATGYEFDDVYKNSDTALYEAKHQGKNGCIIKAI